MDHVLLCLRPVSVYVYNQDFVGLFTHVLFSVAFFEPWAMYLLDFFVGF